MGAIVIIGIIVIIAIFLFKQFDGSNTSNSNPASNNTYQSNNYTPTSSNEIKESPSSEKRYKTKGVKEFDIKGINMRGLTQGNAGKFYGYVKTENNPHDRYAVAIYNNEGLHLGYTPKGNAALFNTINDEGGNIEAWGYIKHIEDNRQNERYLCGNVFIPVFCNEDEIKEAVEEFKKCKVKINVTIS